MSESRWYAGIPGVNTESFPYFVPVFSNVPIKRVCMVDLDREIFTADYGVHFKLNAIQKDEWITALAQGEYGDRLAFPGLVLQPLQSITCQDLYFHASKEGAVHNITNWT